MRPFPWEISSHTRSAATRATKRHTRIAAKQHEETPKSSPTSGSGALFLGVMVACGDEELRTLLSTYRPATCWWFRGVLIAVVAFSADIPICPNTRGARNLGGLYHVRTPTSAPSCPTALKPRGRACSQVPFVCARVSNGAYCKHARNGT